MEAALATDPDGVDIGDPEDGGASEVETRILSNLGAPAASVEVVDGGVIDGQEQVL